MNKIPFHKPLDIPFSKKELSGILSNGKYCRKLEKQIKELYDVEHVITTSSCSIALLITLQIVEKKYALGYMATPSFGWFSTKWAIDTIKSLDTLFVDIERDTWLMSDTSYWNTLPIHTFGSIYKDPYSENKIYDGAHALGSKITDFGIATVMSLAPTKIITSCEGGLILTNDHDLAKDIIFLRDKISRMSEINAIWGLETLLYLEEVMNWKKKCYYYYKRYLSGYGTFQEIPNDSNFNTIGFLTDFKMPEQIDFRKYYFPLKKGFPNTNYVYGKMVCLPSWFGVDYEYITNRIIERNEVIRE